MVTRSACTTNERGAPLTHIPSHLQECWWLLVKVLSIAKTLEQHWNLGMFSRWSAGEYEVSGRPIRMILDNSELRGNALVKDASTLGVSPYPLAETRHPTLGTRVHIPNSGVYLARLILKMT